MNPWQAFVRSVEAEPAAPRVTFYERTPGPNQGERIELSGKVLLNWASKAANLLVEEFDVEPGQLVALDLPLSHWRTAYWMLAAWGAGAGVVATDTDADAPQHPAAADADVRIGTGDGVDLFVTLPALARSAPGPVPAGALDEAQVLPTFADQYTPTMPADEGVEALPGVTFAELGGVEPAERAYLAAPTPERIFAGLLGSGIMLVRGPVDEAALAPLLQQEALRA